MPNKSPEQDLVQLERVSRVFDGGTVVALRDVSLSIGHGDCIAILGASGSGKSSLINLLSGIDAPTDGRVLWKGQPVTSRRQWAELRAQSIGIVFQEFHLLPTLTALENVEIAMFGQGIEPKVRSARAKSALRRVGLGARLDHRPNALSGGERQRVAIARSIVNWPTLLLADEPTGNLDSATAAMIADLLLKLHVAGNMALVLVTHDEALARRCERRIRIKDGAIAEPHDIPIAPRHRLEAVT
jgi:putative ABC transport system ATP-binding protein